ncbi:MAG: hypothetical protein QF749_13310 [Verrucomicrobiota bacterium]|jgi:hypothetical protein|nr:hypothetical protein [Planctomycetota bacterium]MDP7179258.1 hypothetical protein [Verrucomicrobiota bacterium]|tara:strand:+ start:131 stop:514 length:384 start_codon:yes stop_codon:yes gene_type:complete
MPRQLAAAKQRFEHWRRTRIKRERIPDRLWVMAVKAAAEHGIAKTAGTLRLNAASLKEEMGKRAGADSPVKDGMPAFVQLALPPAASGPECVVEVEDGQGAKLRIHLKGGASTDLTALSRVLWSRER